MLYSFGIEIILLFVRVLALFSKKTAHFLKVRANSLETIQSKISVNDQVLWFHCASLGEFEQARPLIESCKKDFPNHRIALTFFSPSGYEVQKNYAFADVVTYLPLDRKKSVLRFIEALRPQVLFLIKYEFWPNLISELQKQKIPVFSVASIFRKQQLFFKPWGFYMKNILKKIDFFFVQNEASQKLLSSVGIENTLVIGDTRTDRVLDILNQDNTNETIADFIQDQDCFVVGSSWPEDVAILSKTIDSKSNLKTIIAPHNVDEASLREVELSFHKTVIRWSDLSQQKKEDADILLIDCVGILTKIYSYADIAYVGGGMGTKGLHNTLEPAVFGIPILIGKNYTRYQETSDLVALGGIVSVDSSVLFENEFLKIVADKNLQKEMGLTNLNYIKKQAGATSKILLKLKEVY
ncbi:MAG: glycosyltransferase N-terminal domain-containing protein [Flavobacteriaceae bacterium]|jgi:3-deoxy-D-manno-octulosonic-acid transferase|nr:glycosyltransferase N-terminal domain-containing protein [Flavobacteriaceae bacterium]MDG1091007.1 glycosyltransferase N-terminal domain-containing protein [Flavobacteriaceae bacterium]